ncbi:hypothetical protein HDU93_008760 [Gonapodya sp. JEL0774]|nr:hypothetical protein HDU93_008760 [Gonapodya sp. JEL0774]
MIATIRMADTALDNLLKLLGSDSISLQPPPSVTTQAAPIPTNTLNTSKLLRISALLYSKLSVLGFPRSSHDLHKIVTMWLLLGHPDHALFDTIQRVDQAAEILAAGMQTSGFGKSDTLWTASPATCRLLLSFAPVGPAHTNSVSRAGFASRFLRSPPLKGAHDGVFLACLEESLRAGDMVDAARWADVIRGYGMANSAIAQALITLSQPLRDSPLTHISLKNINNDQYSHLPLLRLFRAVLPQTALHFYWTLVLHRQPLEQEMATEIVEARIAVGDPEGAVRDLERWPGLALHPDSLTAAGLSRRVEASLHSRSVFISRRALQYLALAELPTPLGPRIASRQSLSRGDNYFTRIRESSVLRSHGREAQEDSDLAALLLYSHARAESWDSVGFYWGEVLCVVGGKETDLPALALLGMVRYHVGAMAETGNASASDPKPSLLAAVHYFKLFRENWPDHPPDPRGSFVLALALAKARSLRPLASIISDAAMGSSAAWDKYSISQLLATVAQYGDVHVLLAMVERLGQVTRLDSACYAPIFSACGRVENWAVFRQAWQHMWEQVIVNQGEIIGSKCATAVIAALARGVREVPSDASDCCLTLPSPLPAQFNPIPADCEDWLIGTSPPMSVLLRTEAVLQKGHQLSDTWWIGVPIIALYARFGKVEDAKRILAAYAGESSNPPVEALNAVLSGYLKIGDTNGAWSWAQENMLVAPHDGKEAVQLSGGDTWTMNMLLGAELRSGQSIRSWLSEDFIKDGKLDGHATVLSRAIDTTTVNTLASTALLPHAAASSEVPLAWRRSGPESAVRMLSSLNGRPLWPSHVTHNILIKACIQLGDIDKAKRIVERIVELGYAVDGRTFCTLMSGIVRNAIANQKGSSTQKSQKVGDSSKGERTLLEPAYALLTRMSEVTSKHHYGMFSVQLLTIMATAHLRLGELRQAVQLCEKFKSDYFVTMDLWAINVMWLGLVNSPRGARYLIAKQTSSVPESYRE